MPGSAVLLTGLNDGKNEHRSDAIGILSAACAMVQPLPLSGVHSASRTAPGKDPTAGGFHFGAGYLESADSWRLAAGQWSKESGRDLWSAVPRILGLFCGLAGIPGKCVELWSGYFSS